MCHGNPPHVALRGNIFFLHWTASYYYTNNLAEYQVVRKGMELLLEAGAEEFFWGFKVSDIRAHERL